MPQRNRLSPKTLGLGICAVGISIALFFALADVVGMGRNPAIFGYHQLLGTTTGLVLIVIGFTFFLFGDGNEQG